MSIRKISLLVACCLLATVCSAQKVKSEFKPRQIVVKDAPFTTHAQAITNRALNRYPQFTRSTNFISNKPHRDILVPNYRSHVMGRVLTTRLEPLVNKEPGKNITFSGHFVSTKKALDQEIKRYTRPEFQQDADQAVRDMLFESTKFSHGYGIVKVYETLEGSKAEPKMSVLVLDLEKLDWSVYTGKENPSNKTLSDKIDPNKPTLFILEDGQTAVLIHNQQHLRDIRDARGYLDSNNNWVEHNQPFYVKFTPIGEPLPLNDVATAQLGSDVKVYKHYLLGFAASESGPFFSSMKELKAYLQDPQAWAEKANRQAIQDRQQNYPDSRTETADFLKIPDTPTYFLTEKTPEIKQEEQPSVSLKQANEGRPIDIHSARYPADATKFLNPSHLYEDPRTGQSYPVLENVHRPVPPTGDQTSKDPGRDPEEKARFSRPESPGKMLY